MKTCMIQPERQQLIRALFDAYIEMYASRDDRLTAHFSENFSGYAGSSDILVKDRDEWIKITRQDFAQVPGRIRIEMLDFSLQDISDDVVIVTAFFHIHLPIPEHFLASKTARLVLVFRCEGGTWKIAHSGISIPFHMRAGNGEVYPLPELQERNLELEALVEERTKALEEMGKYDKLRSQTLELVAEGADLSLILDVIVYGVERLDPAILCSIALLDSTGKHLNIMSAPSLPDFYKAAVDRIEIGMGVGSCGTCASTGERCIVDEVATHPYWEPYRELAASAKLGACWCEPIRDSLGQVLGTLAIYHHTACTPSESDIFNIAQFAHLASIAIERSIAAEKLRESEALYRLLTEDSKDVVWKLDSKFFVTYISPADERLRGYRADEVVGRHVFELFTEEGVVAVKEIMRQREMAKPQGIEADFVSFEALHRCKDGSLLWGEIFSQRERDAHGAIIGYHGTTREITQRKLMEERVREMAFYDTLTNLPNRRLLSDRISQAMAASKRSAHYCALMFLDLDNFKPLNDTHGHEVGDLLLLEVADRLKRSVREIDTVARVGGDEFVVMLSELSKNKMESIDQAKMAADKIRITLAAPYLLKKKCKEEADVVVQHRCTASIGVALFIDNESSQQDILKWADTAMYEAKEAGRNLIWFHDGND